MGEHENFRVVMPAVEALLDQLCPSCQVALLGELMMRMTCQQFDDLERYVEAHARAPGRLLS